MNTRYFCGSYRNQGDLIFSFQPSLYPPLFFLVLYPLVFLGMHFRVAPKVLPLNCVSSFSHSRFTGKLKQLHFSALEEH